MFYLWVLDLNREDLITGMVAKVKQICCPPRAGFEWIFGSSPIPIVELYSNITLPRNFNVIDLYDNKLAQSN